MALSKRCFIICRSGTPIPSGLGWLGPDCVQLSYAKLSARLRKLVVPRETEITNKRLWNFAVSGIGTRTYAMKTAFFPESAVYSSPRKSICVASSAPRLQTGDVSTGRAWMADLSLTRNHFVYGGSERLPEAGSYRVMYKLKVSQNAYAPNPGTYARRVRWSPRRNGACYAARGVFKDWCTVSRSGLISSICRASRSSIGYITSARLEGYGLTYVAVTRRGAKTA